MNAELAKPIPRYLVYSMAVIVLVQLLLQRGLARAGDSTAASVVIARRSAAISYCGAQYAA
jgi:hypothetical protein